MLWQQFSGCATRYHYSIALYKILYRKKWLLKKQAINIAVLLCDYDINNVKLIAG